MDELKISLSDDGVKKPNEENIIYAITNNKELCYKFIVGNEGIWNTIQDYSKDNKCKWTPKEEGKYMIMVQAKKKDSIKPFDIMAKEQVIVDNSNNFKIIKDVRLNSTDIMIGEKNTIEVISDESKILYRFWRVGEKGWEALRDYSIDNKFTFTAIREGNQEVVVECKRLNSEEKFDEFVTVKFHVRAPLKTEIIDFKSLTDNMIINEELLFKVEASYSDKRSLIYKYIKIDKEGKGICIQDYSSKKLVNFKESIPGDYKLLCMVRDLLSNSEYDDRAIMYYTVKPYNKIKIESFISDVSSPQVDNTIIKFTAKCIGGRELLYRYIIEGVIAEDSGYIKNNEYLWQPKEEGNYTITMLVKDISYEGDYEAKETINYVIDKKSDRPVRIKDLLISNKDKILIGTPINIKAIAEGGIKHLYSFIVYKNGVQKERIEYSTTNWANFIPEEKGEYEIEVRVKDRYSTKEYDSNMILKVKALNYIPAEIDYILCNNNERYLVDDVINLEVITQNTKFIQIRYVTKINGGIIEDTGYVNSKRLKMIPRCKGKYTFEIYARNVRCEEGYDSKKEVSINVYETTPVSGVSIFLNKEDLKVNEEVTFYVESLGGKQVMYEFYVNEGGNWCKVQEYSRKNYYTFMPFIKGKYTVLVTAKSYYKKVNYEDYEIMTFDVH